MASITTADVKAYIAKRLADRSVTTRARDVRLKDGTTRRLPERTRAVDGVSNAEINRELTLLKRMFTLAVQCGKLLHKPHIPLLKEENTRIGFFEPEQFEAVQANLPPDLQALVEFAYITGWRLISEVAPLQWRQVDFNGREIRLDPGSTKNGEGRTFPITDDLRRLLEARYAEHVRLRKQGQVEPRVFFREVAKGRGGDKRPMPIKAITKAWKTACRAAGCPGRIPHDLRRTAVRNMVRRTVAERVAMQLSGHKTRSVFERYNIVSPGDLKTAATLLQGLTGTKKGQLSLSSTEVEGEGSKIVK